MTKARPLAAQGLVSPSLFLQAKSFWMWAGGGLFFAPFHQIRRFQLRLRLRRQNSFHHRSAANRAKLLGDLPSDQSELCRRLDCFCSFRLFGYPSLTSAPAGCFGWRNGNALHSSLFTSSGFSPLLVLSHILECFQVAWKRCKMHRRPCRAPQMHK